MCHEPTAHPAIPHDPDAAIPCERLTLFASDAAEFAALVARPRQPGDAGVIVLPDIRGLSSFYGEVASRLAEQGYTAAAIDFFGRTSGIEEREADFPYMEHAARLTRPELEADLAATVGYLRSAAGGPCRTLFTLGFCFGGRQSFLAATLGHNLAGAIGFYGYPSAIRGAPGPTQRAGDIASPVLAIWGGADEGMPPDDVAAFDAALEAAGVVHEMITYPGAPHAFFELAQAEFAAASADAWRRTLEFMRRYGSRAHD